MALMNFSEYAKHRGVTQQAVSYAVQEGRITVTVDPKNGKRFIDSERADGEWDKNTDYARHPEKESAKERRENGAEKVESVPGAGSRTGNTPTITESKQIKEAFLARIAKLEYERMSGKVVPLDEMNREWLKVCGAVKTKLLGIPSKLKGKLEHLTLEDIATIEDEIRAAMADLSDNRGEML